MTTYYLEVTFDGLAAWVPRINAEQAITGYFVLWPDARFAERAYWSKPDNGAQPHVCEPHQAILVMNAGDLGPHDREPDAVVCSRLAPTPRALFLIDYSEVMLPALPPARLTFEVSAGHWSFERLPHMAEISPRHRWVRRSLRPDGIDFTYADRGLAGSVLIDRGNLSVSRVFNRGEALFFADVESRHGELIEGRTIRKRPVGNQVLWRTPLAGDTATVVLRKGGGSNRLVVRADPCSRVARIQLVNAEMEGPVFGREDPFELPEGKVRYPDPDFGVYYPLSASASRKGRRVVVDKGTTIGSTEKPCAPAVFAGFQRRLALSDGSLQLGARGEDGQERAFSEEENAIDPEVVDEACRYIERVDWIQGVASKSGKLVLFVSPGTAPFVDALAVELEVDRQRIRTLEGRFRTLVDAGASRAACDRGVPELFPGSRIVPVGGRGGVLSCFVWDARGGRYGLTVEHLFAEREVDVCNEVGKAGTFARDGRLAAGEGSADCAIFELNSDGRLMSGLGAADHVAAAHLPQAVGALVHRASNHRLGAQVTCVKACVRYDIDVENQGTVTRETVKVTDQILLFDETGSFAGGKDSGALILMNEAAGGFQAFAPLGICTAYFTGGQLFVASPLAACLGRLGVSYVPRL